MKKVVFLVVLTCPLAGFAQHIVAGIRVNIGPPALRLEVVPAAPSLRHQWIGGYWAWHGGKQVWIEGHWALPPSPAYVWQPAWWENRGGAWYFHEGYWRSADAPAPGVVYQPPPPPGQPEIVENGPPPPIEEVRPPIPFPDALWIPGFWEWNGARHVWVAGRWSARPHGFVWEDYRWRQRRDGKWEHEHGHWHPRDDD